MLQDLTMLGLVCIEAVGLVIFLSWYVKRTGLTATGAEYLARRLAYVGLGLYPLAFAVAYIFPRILADTFANAFILAGLVIMLVVAGSVFLGAWVLAALRLLVDRYR